MVIFYQRYFYSLFTKPKTYLNHLQVKEEISDDKEHFSMTGYLSYSPIFNFRQYHS